MISGSGPAPSSARARGGFTLLEVVIAFSILAMVMAALAGVQTYSVNIGSKALDARDVREMSDTVFRRFIYELQNYTDGMQETGGKAYAEFAGVPRNERHRWDLYTLRYHKRKGMAAGTDPKGQTEDLFGTASKDETGKSSSSSSSSHSSSSSGTGGSSGSGSADASTGVEAYLLSLEVFYTGQGTEEPLLTLSTVVPIPASEEADAAK